MHRRAAATIATILVGVALSGVPSPAAAATAGEIVFECVASLPELPGSGAGTCNGEAEVGMTGTSNNGNPFVVEGTGKFLWDFIYDASCLANGSPPPLWAVQGSAVVDDLVAYSGGSLTRADVELDVAVTMLGGFMLLTIDGTVDLEGDGSVTFSASGVGTFMPVLNTSNGCPWGGPATALVEGVIGVDQ